MPEPVQPGSYFIPAQTSSGPPTPGTYVRPTPSSPGSGTSATPEADAAAAAVRQRTTGRRTPNAEEASYQSQVEAILGEPDTSVGAMSRFLAQQGIDVSRPEVQDILALPHTRELFERWMNDQDPQFETAVVAQLRLRFPSVQGSSYSDAYVGYGIGDIAGGFGRPTTTEYSRLLQEGAGTPSELRGGLPVGGEGADYVVHQETNAIYYKNGVIADPYEGAVIFPPDNSNVAGSALWLRDAREAWSEDRIKSWKKTLVEHGYLPTGAAKSATWTVTFENALAGYHRDKYLHYGQEQFVDETSGGFAGTEITNLNQLRATISGDVVNLYRELYGEDPDDDELDRMTQFVVKTGNKLQRRGISAGAAAGEAVARARGRLEDSPYGEWQADTMENTELRDSLTAAASASSAIMRGY